MGAALVRPALYYQQAPNAGSDGTAAEAEDSSVASTLSGASIAAEAAAPDTPLNSSAAASTLNDDAGTAAEVASPTVLPSSAKSNTTSGAAVAEDSSVVSTLCGAGSAAETAAPATPLNSSAAAFTLNDDAGPAAEVASPTALHSSAKSNTSSGAGEAAAPTPLHTSEPEASTLNVVAGSDVAKAAAPILNNSFAPAVPSTMYLPPELPGVLPPIDRFQVEGFFMAMHKQIKSAGGHGFSKNSEFSLEDMLCFQKDPIPTSLLKLSDDLERHSLELFKSVLKYMGIDSPAIISLDERTNIIRNLYRHTLKHSILRDELFAQISKQTRKNPNRDWSIRAWELLYLCTSCMSPSKDIGAYLSEYVHYIAHSETTDSDVRVLALNTLDMLKRTIKVGPRATVPARGEIQALLTSRKLKTIVFFLDEYFEEITYDMTTTVADAVEELAGIIKLSVCSGFSLFECRKVVYHNKSSKVGNEEYVALLDDKKYIGDLLSEFKSAKDTNNGEILHCKILFKKRHFRKSDEFVTDPKFIQLSYVQLQHDYVLGNYPVDRDDAAQLSALQIMVEIGYINSPESSVEWNILLEKFLPRHVAIARARRDWELDISSRYQKMEHLSKHDAQQQFFRILRTLPYGNSVFFSVRNHHDDPFGFEPGRVPERVILGINKRGVHFFRPVTKEYLHSAELRDIWEYGSGNTFVFFKMRVAGFIRIFQFDTKQGEEICIALQTQINDALDRRNSKNKQRSKELTREEYERYKDKADRVKQRLPEQPTKNSLEPSRIDDEIEKQLQVLDRTVKGSERPAQLNFLLLLLITNRFSDEQRIGHGGCGVVYKGVLRNGVTIAVKRLSKHYTLDSKMFHGEVTSMMMVNHQNIVRFLGFCSQTEEQAQELGNAPEKVILAETRERLLCFEYISNGSLDNHVSDELRGLEWHTRYQIIKGICEGLHHLHNEKSIIHMDLKPANILLDDHMIPKITDFGLSRFLDGKSQTMDAKRHFTLGYCAPEYLDHGKISAKSDIFSLGVIILELVTGSKNPNSNFTKVHRRWRHRWNKSGKDTQQGHKQVAICLSLALRCTDKNPVCRPNISDIINDLNEVDSRDAHINDDATDECLELVDMLGIEPLEVHLPCELNKQVSWPVELTNDTDDCFAFMISTDLRLYNIHPEKGTLPPQSKRSVTVTLETPEKALLQQHRRDEFTVHSTRVNGCHAAMDISRDMFNEERGKVVDEVKITVVPHHPDTVLRPEI